MRPILKQPVRVVPVSNDLKDEAKLDIIDTNIVKCVRVCVDSNPL